MPGLCPLRAVGTSAGHPVRCIRLLVPRLAHPFFFQIRARVFARGRAVISGGPTHPRSGSPAPPRPSARPPTALRSGDSLVRLVIPLFVRHWEIPRTLRQKVPPGNGKPTDCKAFGEDGGGRPSSEPRERDRERFVPAKLCHLATSSEALLHSTGIMRLAAGSPPPPSSF